MNNPSESEFLFAGVAMKLVLSGEDTGQSFCLFSISSAGDSNTPVHFHANEDETLYISSGEMHAIVAGQEHTVRQGEAVFLPRGIPHQLINRSGRPADYLILCTPSGFERFVTEAGRLRNRGEEPHPPTPDEIARMIEAAPRFGITLLPGW